MEVEPRAIAVDSIRDFVDRSFRPLAEQKGLELRIEVATNLPATIRSDPQRLQQVLKNLLSNAFKFTEKGGVTLSIRRPEKGTRFIRESIRDQQVVEFAVTDTGIGIPPDKHQIIF